jgi:hypothetical protein
MLRRFWQDSLRAVCARLLITGSAHSPPPGTPGPGDLGFRFHGYLRSRFGVDSTGKGQQPFIAPLARSKYRLGNEAETYLETTFNYGTT